MNRQMTCGTSSISFQNPEQIPGKLQKALCKNRPLCWQSKKTASPVPIYSFFLQATCWLRHQHLLSEPLI